MRFPRSLQWRITFAYTALIVLSMGGLSLYLVNFVRDSYYSSLETGLRKDAVLVSEAVSNAFKEGRNLSGVQSLIDQLGASIGARVTIIARGGSVLADSGSNSADLKNVSDSPELSGMLAGHEAGSAVFGAENGRDVVLAVSTITLDGDFLGVARLAVPTTALQENVTHILGAIAISAAVVTVLSVLLGSLLARRTSRSVRALAQGVRYFARGELDHRVYTPVPDETKELAEAFNRMADTIRDTIAELSGEQKKLSAVLETMTDAVLVVSPEGRIELFNAAAEGLLDVKARDALGARFLEVVRDHELRGLVTQCLETRKPQQSEVEFLYPHRFLSATSVPLGEADRQNVLLTLHDLTRVHQVETTRKEFVSNVSHELRNPLASIKAMVEALESGALEETEVAADFLRRIESDVDRMDSMVDDLLAIARLESGQAELQFVPLDLRALVDDVVHDYGERVAAKNISLVVDLPDDLPRVLAEGLMVREVLINLLDNALKFTGEHGTITVAADAGNGFINVRVRDTGIGIDAEHLPHVFERFYKADRARHDGGTGLGLAIVKHIVQAHGGDVNVTSRIGEGSTFSFSLKFES